MAWNVELRNKANKSLHKIKDRALLKRITRALKGLADNPKPKTSKSIEGSDGLLRLRVGDYRIIYEIHDHTITVLVIDIGHRKNIYKNY